MNTLACIIEINSIVMHGGCVKEWIMEQWEKNYYISALAGANNGSSLVVMSKGNFPNMLLF